MINSATCDLIVKYFAKRVLMIYITNLPLDASKTTKEKISLK
jgi:hypothetical protein